MLNSRILKSYRSLTLNSEDIVREPSLLQNLKTILGQSFYLLSAVSLYPPSALQSSLCFLGISRRPASPSEEYSVAVLKQMLSLIILSTRHFITPERTPSEAFYELIKCALNRVSEKYSCRVPWDTFSLEEYEIPIAIELVEITGFCDEHIELLLYAPLHKNALLYWLEHKGALALGTETEPSAKCMALIKTISTDIADKLYAYWAYINEYDIAIYDILLRENFFQLITSHTENQTSLIQRIYAAHNNDELQTNRELECIFNMLPRNKFHEHPRDAPSLLSREQIRLLGPIDLIGLKEEAQKKYFESVIVAQNTLENCQPKEMCPFLPSNILSSSPDHPFTQYIFRRFPTGHRARQTTCIPLLFRRAPSLDLPEAVVEWCGFRFFHGFIYSFMCQESTFRCNEEAHSSQRLGLLLAHNMILEATRLISSYPNTLDQSSLEKSLQITCEAHAFFLRECIIQKSSKATGALVALVSRPKGLSDQNTYLEKILPRPDSPAKILALLSTIEKKRQSESQLTSDTDQIANTICFLLSFPCQPTGRPLAECVLEKCDNLQTEAIMEYIYRLSFMQQKMCLPNSDTNNILMQVDISQLRRVKA